MDRTLASEAGNARSIRAEGTILIMVNKIRKITVESDATGQRLDVFLAFRLKITRSQAQRMISGSLVLLNDKAPKKAGQRVRSDDKIEVLKISLADGNTIFLKKDEEIKKLSLRPELTSWRLGFRRAQSSRGTRPRGNKEISEIEVISETPDYLIINKPAGLLVHQTEAGEPCTLASWLLKKYPKLKKVGEALGRPGMVHRLDREASGLLAVAKTQKMFEHLKKQFQERSVVKEYSVLVRGVVKKDFAVIDFEIDRGAGGRMVARPKTDKLKVKNVDKIQPGKEAITEFVVEKRFARFTLLKVKIHTGRTNQIRVHLFAYTHPVVGDKLYFNRKLIKKNEQKLERLFLHSAKLCFRDLSEEKKCFASELPAELKNYLDELK